MLDSNQQYWKTLDIKLPYEIHGDGAQFINNNLYIFGGYNRNNNRWDGTYKLLKSLQWEKMANMNKKRWGISNSNVMLNSQIWVCGGRDEKYSDLKSVEMYDPLTNTCNYMKQMNECRRDAAATVVNGKIFCSGGEWVDSVECYDPSSDIWTLICNMPLEIWGHGAVEINGNFIVMGGNSKRECLKNVWELDTTDKNTEWIERSSMTIPCDRFSIAKTHDKIFICGGNCIGNAVQIFDGKVWRSGPRMPTRRVAAAALTIPMQFARDLEQFTVVSVQNESPKCSVQ